MNPIATMSTACTVMLVCGILSFLGIIENLAMRVGALAALIYIILLIVFWGKIASGHRVWAIVVGVVGAAYFGLINLR